MSRFNGEQSPRLTILIKIGFFYHLANRISIELNRYQTYMRSVKQVKEKKETKDKVKSDNKQANL